MQVIDKRGKKIGRLLVVERAGSNKQGNAVWKCICDCGNTSIVSSGNLRKNHTQSCGCLKLDRIKESNTRHGLAQSRFERIFSNMKSRCKDKTNIYYGAKGIKVLWNSFEEFRNDMYESYLKHVEDFGETNTSIDRIRNNGHYYLDNCRWATKKEQSVNRHR